MNNADPKASQGTNKKKAFWENHLSEIRCENPQNKAIMRVCKLYIKYSSTDNQVTPQHVQARAQALAPPCPPAGSAPGMAPLQ